MSTDEMTAVSTRVPFLNLAAQQAEVSDEVLPRWRELFETAQFVGGSEVSSFEAEYARYIGVEHCVGVANGTDALELAYRAVGVGPGDEVIIPVNTFVATAEAATRIGAVPVFVDCDEHLLLDVDAVEAAITARTRAIVPVHLYGQVADVAALRVVARRHDLAIVEDAAQAQGASSQAGRAGALGRAAATSFYPSKNLGAAGDAGAVLTDDPELAAYVRSFAAHGGASRYVHDVPGMNSRLDAVQAVLLRAKLLRLDAWTAARTEAAGRYGRLLSGMSGVQAPTSLPGNDDVWHLYVVQVDDRDRVSAEMDAAGVDNVIHYPHPLHLTPAYAPLGYRRGQFPVAEAAAKRILSLPLYPHITAPQQERVAEALHEAVR
ncbi:DegT/DnrJ/EryC1/StrS family aminotransferase [Microbacterium oryzae]|uniref:DegT/DnrJ/EryC1/StrS family aminotransferase n=1 Tax=Microbacterium oryzae TaxID=743009 RepID=UPI0025B27E6E|nr:DegT/DnrJ/EryC1/StrS family aminotransferase [Microbacterium oryzae]MDN3310108.1 DegT/DnrJ/EryC1/StrS family aminotransferase [Microbacterium oryzae]